MSKQFLRTCLPLALVAAAATSLAAQGTALSNLEIKVRGGYTMGNLFTDLRTQRMMGIAVGTSVPLPAGRLLLDLGFEYFPGADFDNMPTTGTFYYNPDSPTTAPIGIDPQTVTTRTSNGAVTLKSAGVGSADRRKNRFQGFNLRVGYGNRLAGTWDWQAGLALENYTATEEVSGTLYPFTYVTTTPTTPFPATVVTPTLISNPTAGGSYYESLMYVNQKTKLGLGAFAGVSTRLSDEIRLEFNLRSVSYTKLKYMPFTYTGQAPTTLETTRRGLALEVSLGMKM
jgi:hypothetical protein